MVKDTGVQPGEGIYDMRSGGALSPGDSVLLVGLHHLLHMVHYPGCSSNSVLYGCLWRLHDVVVIPFPAPSLRSLENGKWGRSSKVLIMAFFFSFKFCSLEHKQGEQQAEGEAGFSLSRESDMGLDPRTLRS